MIRENNIYHLVMLITLLISLINLPNLFATEEQHFSKIVFYVA
jgi:hypothetical protein